MIRWLVLTGGASTRLGRDKATALLDGSTLAERAIASIESADPAASVTEVGADRPGGPAAAVVAVLPTIQEALVGVLAVDMPFAKQALVALVELVDGDTSDLDTSDLDTSDLDTSEIDTSEIDTSEIEAWVPVGADGRRQWLCAVYRREALVRAMSAGLDGSLDWNGAPFHRLVGDLTTSLVPIASDVSLLDIDTPQDLERARRVVEDRGI